MGISHDPFWIRECKLPVYRTAIAMSKQVLEPRPPNVFDRSPPDAASADLEYCPDFNRSISSGANLYLTVRVQPRSFLTRATPFSAHAKPLGNEGFLHVCAPIQVQIGASATS